MVSEKSQDTGQRLDALLAEQTDWLAFGAMTNSWSKASGIAQYRKRLGGVVEVQLQNIAPGTTTNGTTIWSSANGLPAGFRPGIVLYWTVRSDATATQTPAFRIDTDGHFECFGISASATRCDVDFSFLAEN